MELQLWKEFLLPYELAVEEIMVKFKHIAKEYRDMGLFSPIESVHGRVKKISSIIEKAYRKGISLDRLEEQMDDIAGIRIMCQFVEDIERVVEILRERTDMKILKEQDYINNIKSSGYRSYHITVEYEVQTIYGRRKLLVEIQIRTLAMNFWAVIEHSLQYKYRAQMPERINERLLASAEAVFSLDAEMSSIREDVMAAQHAFREKANLVESIFANLENLHKVVDDENILNLQQEFYRLYQSGDLDQLVQFNKRLDKMVQKSCVQDL